MIEVTPFLINKLKCVQSRGRLYYWPNKNTIYKVIQITFDVEENSEVAILDNNDKIILNGEIDIRLFCGLKSLRFLGNGVMDHYVLKDFG